VSAKPPKSAPFAVKLAYYAEGPVDVRLCAQMKYHHRECRGHLVDRYCPTIRGHIFNSGPCKDWHTPERALRAGQKILVGMREQLADLALEEAMTKAANEPLTDEELAIVDVAYERGKVSLAEVRINMLQRRIGALQAERDAACSRVEQAGSDITTARLLLRSVWRSLDAAGRSMGRSMDAVALETAMELIDRNFKMPFAKAQLYDENPVGFIESARAALSAVSDQQINDRGYNPKPHNQPQPIITPPPPRPTDPESAGRSNP
jgi:hypothetical protein